MAHALELAVAFGQNAIVKVEHGQPAELVTTALMPERLSEVRLWRAASRCRSGSRG